MVKKVIHVTATEIVRLLEDNLKTFKFDKATEIDMSKATFVKANVWLKEFVELIVDIPIDEAVKSPDTVIQEISNEPEFRIDDIVILKPRSDTAASFLRYHGYAWKISQASKSKWYLGNIRRGGFFSGKVNDLTVLDLPKEFNSPDRMYEVIAVVKFPKEFKSSKMYNELCQKFNGEENLIKELKMCDNLQSAST